MNIFIRLINFIKDLQLPFSECRQCKHKKYCSHKVWTTPYKDCRYWEIHKFEKRK